MNYQKPKNFILPKAEYLYVNKQYVDTGTDLQLECAAKNF